MIAALGSVVAFFYYAAVAPQDVVPRPGARGGHHAHAGPAALTVAIGLTVAFTVVVGVYPQIVARIGELAFPV